ALRRRLAPRRRHDTRRDRPQLGRRVSRRARRRLVRKGAPLLARPRPPRRSARRRIGQPQSEATARAAARRGRLQRSGFDGVLARHGGRGAALPAREAAVRRRQGRAAHDDHALPERRRRPGAAARWRNGALAARRGGEDRHGRGVELSTILEVLRKAQEDARRKPEPGKVPGGLFDDAERRRRRRRLLFAVGAVVVLGFVGGWWFGARLRAPEPTAEDDGRLAVADATSPGRDAEPSAARSPGAEPGIGGTSAAPETKAEEPPAAKTAPAPAPATAPGAVEDARRAAPPAPEGSGAAAQPPSVPAAPPAAAKAAPQVPPAALRARAGDASSETALAAQRA